jgi:4-amino-4-deoxychorismate lyase
MWYDVITQRPIEHVAIDERVISYGDGFFTTIAVVNGEVNWLDYHAARIRKSCQALQLTVDIPAALTALQQQASTIQQGMLKLVVCRARQPNRGYGFVNGDAHVWLSSTPMPQSFAKQANQVYCQPPAYAVMLRQQIACLPKPLAGLKLLNAQDKALASAELLSCQAQIDNLFEGLVQNVLGEWVEGTFCNLFYRLQDGQWFTPPLTQSGVAGVMRQVVIDQCAQCGQPIAERVLTQDDISELTSLVFCNAVRGLVPIARLYTTSSDYRSLTLAYPIPIELPLDD